MRGTPEGVRWSKETWASPPHSLAHVAGEESGSSQIELGVHRAGVQAEPAASRELSSGLIFS